MRVSRAWVFAFLTLTSGITAAHPIEELDQIRARAQAHARAEAGADAEVRIGQLDPRLRLRACTSALETFSPATNGTSAVGVRCTDPQGWTLYVPVTMTRMADVAVLTRSLPRGAILAAEDLRTERRRMEAGAVAAYDSRQAPIGYELRQALGAGTILGPQHVRPLLVIRRGAQVLLTATQSGIVVRMQGQALADAAAGTRVRARNVTTRRIVEGIARADGTVEIAL